MNEEMKKLLNALVIIISKKGVGCRSSWDILQSSVQGQDGLFNYLKSMDDQGFLDAQEKVKASSLAAFWRLQRAREALHKEHFNFCKTAVHMVVSMGGEDGQGYFSELRLHIPTCAARLDEAVLMAAAADALWFPWRRKAARKEAWGWVEAYMRSSQPGGPIQPSFADDFENDTVTIVENQHSKDVFAATQQGAVSAWCRAWAEKRERVYTPPSVIVEPEAVAVQADDFDPDDIDWN